MTRLRMICQSWKVMFHAEYSSGQPVSMLVDLRNGVDAALVKNAKRAAAAAAHDKSARPSRRSRGERGCTRLRGFQQLPGLERERFRRAARRWR